MELSKCVIFLLNIVLYSGRFDFVFLHNMNEGSAKSSETDGYAKNVENLVNDKRTINTLKKINNGARQVMNTITSKLIRHASDKITKHVGNIIRSSVSSKKSISTENAQLRSPIPLSSNTEVVLPALSIAKLSEKGYDNTTLTANVKDLSSPANATTGFAKSNETAPAQNSTLLNNNPPKANLSNNAPPENSTTANNHSFSIKYQSDAGDLIETKQTAAHVNDNSTVFQNINNTANSTTVNGTKYSDVPVVRTPDTSTNASSYNGTHRSEITVQPPAVSSFVSAPPIGPMESISIDLKGKASTFKNFSKVPREPELFRSSKNDILNFENNSILSADNIVKRDYIPKSSTIIPAEGPISNELESTLMAKTSPSKAIRSSLPFQPISSSTSSKSPSPVAKESKESFISTTSRAGNANKASERRAFKDKDEGVDEQEDGSSGESGDGEGEEIDHLGHRKYKLKPGAGKKKRKHRTHKQKKFLYDSTTLKVSPIKKVPILTINTDDSINTAHTSNKVIGKKHKHKSEFSKTHSGYTGENMGSGHHKKKHHHGNNQTNRYHVFPMNVSETGKDYFTPVKDDMATDGAGILPLDLSSLPTNQTHKVLPSMELDGEHKPNTQDVTFTLGHNEADELQKNHAEKGPLHAGHNHAGEHGIDHDLPQDDLVEGKEQGPLLPGHEQGPLLPGHEQGPMLPGNEKGPLLPEQEHAGDFSHHEEDNDKGHGQVIILDHAKWGHHSQPSGPNYVEEPLQVPPVPAEINPGIPNAVNNFPGGRLAFNLPSTHPIISLEGLLQAAPLNNPPLLQDEEKACAQHPPLSPTAHQVGGSVDCPPYSDYPYHKAQELFKAGHNEDAQPPTALPPTLPFEIPSHTKFEKLGRNIEPELLSIIETNSQQMTSLSHEVKNLESRLGNIESIVEVLEKAIYRIEEKVDKLDHPETTYTQREEFADSHAPEEPAHTARHPLLKQYFIPISQTAGVEGVKEIDRNPNNGGLPFPVNKVVAYLLQELQKNKNLQHGQQPILQLASSTPHVPLPQPEMAYPPKEHDIDRLEYEIGRTPKSKFGHKLYHYEALENPCQCENGGDCNGRSDGCDCPLRFTGPRCERPVPRSSLLDSIIDEIPTDTQQQYHSPKKTSLITLPLVISENQDEQDPISQKTVGEVNQSKLVNLLSQFFSPDYLQRFAKREKVTQRRYVKYPLEKEK